MTLIFSKPNVFVCSQLLSRRTPSVVDPGERLPLLLDQTEARKVEKNFPESGLLPYLRVWNTAPPLPYLKVWIRHCTYIQTVSKTTSIEFDNSYLCVDDICLSVIYHQIIQTASRRVFWMYQ